MNSDATVSIQDSMTYPGPAAGLDIGGETLALIAEDGQRPMIRWTASGASWTINGNGGNLIIQGIWLQGADLVLTGSFESVTLRFVTLDPGSSGDKGVLIGAAIDGMPWLRFICGCEASITTLTLERCITGPIRTQGAGAIEQLTATDSIIQAIPTGGGATDYALQTEIGAVSLARCTVLGPSAIHRLDASECILDDVTIAEDTQHGCVRFCALAQGQRRCTRLIVRCRSRLRDRSSCPAGSANRTTRGCSGWPTTRSSRRRPATRSWAGPRTVPRWAPSRARA